MEMPSDNLSEVTQIHSVGDENWPERENLNNSTLLYIAVEYIKNEKLEKEKISLPTNSQETFIDFVTPQVSPLDPNMSSVARYSPVPGQYQENVSNKGPIIIHQYLTHDGNTEKNKFETDLTTESTLADISVEIPSTLCSSEIQSTDHRYLEIGEDENINIYNKDLHAELEGEQQGVELVITDHTTGLSYSVNAQELLVEPCLDQNDQLLEALAPNPLLESDLIPLDDGILKSEFHNEGINSTVIKSVNEEVINNYINCLSDSTKNINCNNDNKIHTRSAVLPEVNEEEQLLSCVYSIMDKPILSRARASLPESYLSVGKVNAEYAVFTKKTIPKGTQFGPLEGVLFQEENLNLPEDNELLLFLILIERNIYRVDVSDENSANWMCFVRKAATYEEQNLILSQENNGLYFTTTKNILPKTELKVGYSSSYAQFFNLNALKPPKNNSWPCYECPEKFTSSEELQKHLNFHDQEWDENVRPKRKYKRKFIVLAKSQIAIVECNICHEPFNSNVNNNTLRKHLAEKHKYTGVKTKDYFLIYQCYQCNYCDTRFKTEILLKIHKLEHDPELSLEQNTHVCPQCQRKFPTRKQLVLHVTNHALPQKVLRDETVKCNICYKFFAHPERLQKHMLVHGSEEAKPLQCKFCRKRFLTNSALGFHLKLHFSGQKNFECPICKERFDHVLKLRLHIPQHAHNNQYTCPHCKKVFTKYSIIRKHIKFHNEPKYSCDQCPKKCITSDNLKKHMLRHTDHREFLCADCGKQFKRKDKLLEHIKKLHPNEKSKCSEKTYKRNTSSSNISNKAEPKEFHRFIYKCHNCLVGFKRRGMLVNHLAKRHPDIPPDSVPELNLPILQTTKDYYCQYCEKVYKSSSKRKNHILKNHPGAALPVNTRQKNNGQTDPQITSFSHTVGSITTQPKNCKWCHKQYACKAKLLKHIRKDHPSTLEENSYLNEGTS